MVNASLNTYELRQTDNDTDRDRQTDAIGRGRLGGRNERETDREPGSEQR